MLENILKWIGGKHALSPFIISKMCNHKRYIEVFAGALNVYWQKPLAEYNIVNDINGSLVNLYKVIKNEQKLKLMILELEDMWYGRDLFLYLRNKYNDKALYDTLSYNCLPDYYRAAIYVYLNKTSFNGRFQHYSAVGDGKIDVEYIYKVTKMMTRKLNYGKGTVIENLPFQELIEKYDEEGVLFYLDPPYWVTTTPNGSNYYEFIMSRQEHIELEKMLSCLKLAKFIMSYDDVPEVKELYKSKYYKKINTPEMYQSAASRQVGQNGSESVFKSELLIANYDLENINTLFG